LKQPNNLMLKEMYMKAIQSPKILDVQLMFYLLLKIATLWPMQEIQEAFFAEIKQQLIYLLIINLRVN